MRAVPRNGDRARTGKKGLQNMQECWVIIGKKWMERLVWLTLGAMAVLVTEYLLLEQGRAIATRQLWRFLAAKPETEEDVQELFSGARNWIVVNTGDVVVFRYRFRYGEDIDVICDRKGHVQDVYPTFLLSWGRPWPIVHRRYYLKIPLKLESGGEIVEHSLTSGTSEAVVVRPRSEDAAGSGPFRE